nr:hypothetical protein Itr_chr02CG12360 [Ipomoea trifida]
MTNPEDTHDRQIRTSGRCHSRTLKPSWECAHTGKEVTLEVLGGFKEIKKMTLRRNLLTEIGVEGEIGMGGTMKKKMIT